MENGSNEDDTGTAAVEQLPGEQLGRELAVPGSPRSSPITAGVRHSRAALGLRKTLLRQDRAGKSGSQHLLQYGQAAPSAAGRAVSRAALSRGAKPGRSRGKGRL